jgi:CheY-like chemotaxis protein
MGGPPRKALVADDDALIRAMLSSELRSLGFAVSEAQNGEEALELYAKDKPDVLFLDLLMPKLNGLDALKKLRAEGSAVPAVLVTALTRDTVKQFEVDGVKPEAYLEKPFRLKAVAKIVKQIFPDASPEEAKEETPTGS